MGGTRLWTRRGPRPLRVVRSRCRRAPLPAAALASALTIAVVTGCARQDDEGTPRPTITQTVVTTAGQPLPRLPHEVGAWQPAPATVSGSTVRWGDRVVNLAPMPVAAAVGTRGGLYALSGGRVWFLGSTGARSPGFTRVHGLVGSSDGEYLGLVDRNHGPARDPRTPLAAAVVYDTVTGRVVLRSTIGMGTLADPLHRWYAARPPRAVGFVGDALVAITPHGRYRYPLDGTRPVRIGRG